MNFARGHILGIPGEEVAEPHLQNSVEEASHRFLDQEAIHVFV
jgi:hypothetical protein